MFLVAIALGHRVSTLQALSVVPGLIHWEPYGVRFFPRAVFCLESVALFSSSGDFLAIPLLFLFRVLGLGLEPGTSPPLVFRQDETKESLIFVVCYHF